MSVITNAESSLFNLSSATDGLRLILETALDAVVVMQSDGVVADWNDRAADVFGWSHDEAVGRTAPGLQQNKGHFLHFVLDTPHSLSTRPDAYRICSAPESTVSLIAV
jgi:PAS domain-containing protein